MGHALPAHHADDAKHGGATAGYAHASTCEVVRDADFEWQEETAPADDRGGGGNFGGGGMFGGGSGNNDGDAKLDQVEDGREREPSVRVGRRTGAPSPVGPKQVLQPY